MNIINLTKNDIDGILLLEKESSFVDGWNKNQFLSSFYSERFVVLGIKEGDKLVAFVGVTVNYDTADIESVLVGEKKRRCGLATALIEKAEEYLIKKAVNKVFLEVRKSNIKAVSLYNKLGYEKISERKKYYSDGEDAEIMAKELKK